jgi:hypothetical protein
VNGKIILKLILEKKCDRTSVAQESGDLVNTVMNLRVIYVSYWLLEDFAQWRSLVSRPAC